MRQPPNHYSPEGAVCEDFGFGDLKWFAIEHRLDVERRVIEDVYSLSFTNPNTEC